MNTEIIKGYILEFEDRIYHCSAKIEYGKNLVKIYTEKGNKQNAIIAVEQNIKDLELCIKTYETMIAKLKELL